MSHENPYAAPSSVDPKPDVDLDIPKGDRAKIEAIVKDAGQFWIALILCLFCSGIGGLIVPIWYSVRLYQWSKFSKKHSSLVSPNSQSGSLARKFRSAQWKFIVGIVFGCVMMLLTTAYFMLLFLGARI